MAEKSSGEQQKNENAPTPPAASSKKGEEAQGSNMAAQVNTLSRTIKLLEDKYYNLRKKVQIDEENSLSQDKKMWNEIKIIKSDVMEIKKEIEDLKDKIRLMVRELKQTAKSEDIKVVKKYLDLWEPVKFVTRNEVQKMIDRAIEEKFE